MRIVHTRLCACARVHAHDQPPGVPEDDQAYLTLTLNLNLPPPGVPEDDQAYGAWLRRLRRASLLQPE